MFKNIGIHSFHQLDIILSDLKGRFLKVEIPRRTADHKTEVDMDNMPHIIHQNIIIMPVLNLEDVLEQRVPRKTEGKVCYSCLPVLPVDLLVYCAQGFLIGRCFQGAYCLCAVDELDETTLFIEGNYLVWFYPQLQVLFIEYFAE